MSVHTSGRREDWAHKAYQTYVELYINFPGQKSSPSIEDLAREIDTIANKAGAFQQAALCIAEQCWVLVNSYNEWRRKHKESLRPPSKKTPPQAKLKNWVRKIKLQAEIELAYETLAIDLKDVAASLRQSTQPELGDEALRDAWELVSTDRVYTFVRGSGQHDGTFDRALALDAELPIQQRPSIPQSSPNLTVIQPLRLKKSGSGRSTASSSRQDRPAQSAPESLTANVTPTLYPTHSKNNTDRAGSTLQPNPIGRRLLVSPTAQPSTYMGHVPVIRSPEEYSEPGLPPASLPIHKTESPSPRSDMPPVQVSAWPGNAGLTHVSDATGQFTPPMTPTEGYAFSHEFPVPITKSIPGNRLHNPVPDPRRETIASLGSTSDLDAEWASASAILQLSSPDLSFPTYNSALFTAGPRELNPSIARSSEQFLSRETEVPDDKPTTTLIGSGDIRSSGPYHNPSHDSSHLISLMRSGTEEETRQSSNTGVTSRSRAAKARPQTTFHPPSSSAATRARYPAQSDLTETEDQGDPQIPPLPEHVATKADSLSAASPLSRTPTPGNNPAVQPWRNGARQGKRLST